MSILKEVRKGYEVYAGIEKEKGTKPYFVFWTKLYEYDLDILEVGSADFFNMLEQWLESLGEVKDVKKVIDGLVDLVHKHSDFFVDVVRVGMNVSLIRADEGGNPMFLVAYTIERYYSIERNRVYYIILPDKGLQAKEAKGV